MSKYKTSKNTKKDFEMVFDNPLDWCPLLGYIPDKIAPIFKTRPVTVDPLGHEDTLSAYDLARDYIDEIVEARTFWGIDKSVYNYFQNQRLPDIEMVSEKNKFEAARWLFKTLFRVAHVSTHYNELIDQWTPFISMRTWKHYEGHVLDRSPEALLRHTQNELNTAGEFLGFNYTLAADEVYALFALHEAWIMFIRLLKNEFTPDDEDLLCESLSYIENCFHHADSQKCIKILNNEINDIEVKTPRTPRKQALYAKKRHEKEAPSIESRNKAIRDKVEEILKNNTKHKSKISVQFVYDKINRDFPTIIGNIKISQFKNVAGDLIKDFKQGRP